jgi:hypothetical protein
MPTSPTHPPPRALRRRLAALRPGRPTTIACAIAIALAATGLDHAQTDAGTATADTRPSDARPAAGSPSVMIIARRENATGRP